MMYQNKETGEILTKVEMLHQFRDDYDGGDPTNPLEWDEYYDEVPDTLKEKLVAKAEQLDWTVKFGDQDNGRYVEFYKYSPAGEDFSFCVWFDGIKDIPHEVSQYYIDFDIDEHIEMWIEARRNGVSGVPSTRELVKDAEDIDDMLEELSDALCEVYQNWDEETEAVE